jgi:outer membrane protein W
MSLFFLLTKKMLIGYKKLKKLQLLPPYFLKKYYFCSAEKL